MLSKLQLKASLLPSMFTMRAFSRASIIKDLDRSKVSRKKFITQELLENPEFFKAYPHL